ncbi:BrxA/BrxB family bacilliredoxin [Bacillus tianshenii]|nr:BrxA/BrxB family bacilliredoxin [Bacillus tianshenii]
MFNAYEEYMKQVIQPMREELTTAGFTELTTAEGVEQYIEGTEGTTLVVVNSVCGCAAGLARPAAIQSKTLDQKPDNFVTVFAGQDKEATAKMREYFTGIEPSSPSMALLKGKDVVHFIHRHEIEDHEISEILDNLKAAYAKHC